MHCALYKCITAGTFERSNANTNTNTNTGAGGMGLSGVEAERASYTIETMVKIAEGTPRRTVDLARNY